MYRGSHRGQRRPNRNGVNAASVIKWRVVSDAALKVTAQQEPDSEVICELERNATMDVLEQATLQSGRDPHGELTVRGMIIDPVWKGWVTLGRVSDAGVWVERACELCDPDDAPRLAERGGGALMEGATRAVPPAQQLTLAQLMELQFEAMADDVPIEAEEMIYWSEAEARLCFESGGACRPERRAPAPAAAGRAADAAEAASAGGAGGDNGDGEAEAAEEAGSPSADASAPEMSEQQRQQRDAGEWAKSTIVLLSGLSEERELNGRSGVIGGWDAARGRYEVRLANRVVRVLPGCLGVHPLQRQREANEARGRGDEVVFLTEDDQLARAGTYAVKLDPQFWYASRSRSDF